MARTVIKYGIEALRSARVTSRSAPSGGSREPEPSWEWDEPPAAETVASPSTRTPAGADATTSAAAEDAPAADAVALDVLEARICALASRIARATYQWLAMIAEFDERGGWTGVGIKSCAHWLAWSCSLAPGTAREHVRVARALTELPLVSAEMAAGRLSYAKVREITRIADRVDETYLVTLARTATASQLARAVRGYRRADGDRVAQQQTRTVTWFTDDDGTVVLSARLPAEDGAALIAALEAARDDIYRREKRSATPAPCSDVDPETAPGAGGTAREPVSRADMLVHLARGYTSAAPKDRSGEDRTTVVVHVSAEHLTDDSARSHGNAADRPAVGAATDTAGIPADCCQIAGVGGIEPETARRLACDATLIGVIRGTGGAVLAYGRERRLVSKAQRRVLQIRDGRCQFPTCDRTSHLEAHHVIHWSRGGRTDLDNLVLLCRYHHTACHEGGARILPAPDSTAQHARWQFRTPDGEPFVGDPYGTLTTTGITAWAHDDWSHWGNLDRISDPRDTEANNIRPLWRGERVSTADTVSALFGKPRQAA